MKLTEIRKHIIDSLNNVDNPSYEANTIIEKIYSLTYTDITLNLFSEYEYNIKIDSIIEKRKEGVPLEYIINEANFYDLVFYVDSNCLIPQRDTEVIIENILPKLNKSSSFIDIGTGSGCIPICISKNTGAHGYSVDISNEALEIAKRNAASNNVEDCIQFINCDVLNDDSFWNNKRYDLIVSNPPYIKTNVINDLSNEVKNEPFIALDGGDDGLIFYKTLIPKLKEHLTDCGFVAFEIGYDQADSVGKLFSLNGFKYEVIKDYGGNDRCIIANM